MNGTTKDALLDADRTFLAETESLLKIYEAMHGLKARPPAAPLGEGVVWAREIAVPTGTVALVATRESLGAKTLHVRTVSAPGRPLVLKDEDAVGLHGLAPVLEKLIGGAPASASFRRPGRPLSRTRRRRHR